MKMKKLLILLTVIVIVLVLAGCGNTDAPTNYAEVPSVETTPLEISSDVVTAWQEAYAEILHYYYVNVPLPDEWLDWHFFLHDVDKDGTPELFIVYLAAGIWSESIYTFADGTLMPIEGSFFAYWGIWPPINRDGIVINAYGLYDLMVTHNGELVTEFAFRQPFFPTDEQRWYINDAKVTHDEFTEMFKSIMPVWVWDGGYIGERTNIFPHIISEANIQDIIFGQYIVNTITKYSYIRVYNTEGRSYATGWAAPFDEGYILLEVGFNADGQIYSIAFDARSVVLTDYFSYEEIRAFAYKIMDYPEIDWSDLITYFDELFGSGGHDVGILHTAFIRAGELNTNTPTIAHPLFSFFR